jgi:hypothetical protein
VNAIKTAHVFASYVANEEYLPFCEKLIEIWRGEFADSDIFVGINPCPLQDEWVRMLENSGLRLRYALVPERLVLPSDASAFQAALTLFRETGGRYDYVWFGHTKGATSRSYEDLTAQLVELYLKKEEVIRALRDSGCGLYALAASVAPRVRDECARFLPFRYAGLPVFCAFTFYVLRADLLHAFLDRCDTRFFSEPIPTAHFFEADFPQLVFRQGYEPFVRKIVQVHTGDLSKVLSNEETFRKTLEAWRKKNRLPAPKGAGR